MGASVAVIQGGETLPQEPGRNGLQVADCLGTWIRSVCEKIQQSHSDTNTELATHFKCTDTVVICCKSVSGVFCHIYREEFCGNIKG